MNADDLNIRVIIDPCLSEGVFPPTNPKTLEANSLFLSIYATELSNNLFLNDNPNLEHYIDINLTPQLTSPALSNGISFEMVKIDISYSTTQLEISELTHVRGAESPVFPHNATPNFDTVEELLSLSEGKEISEDKMHEWSQTAIKSCTFVSLKDVFTNPERRPNAIFPMIMSIIGGALSTLIKSNPDGKFSKTMDVHFASMSAMISALPEEYKILTDALYIVVSATREAVKTRDPEDIAIAHNMYISTSPLIRYFLES